MENHAIVVTSLLVSSRIYSFEKKTERINSLLRGRYEYVTTLDQNE